MYGTAYSTALLKLGFEILHSVSCVSLKGILKKCAALKVRALLSWSFIKTFVL